MKTENQLKNNDDNENFQNINNSKTLTRPRSFSNHIF